jgi:WD40 repeat protein
LSIKKWDITSGNTITEYIGHTGDITQITVAPGYIFSGGFDRTVLMWDEESSKIERTFQGFFTY